MTKQAKDEFCVECGEPAHAYYGISDPDIPMIPFCETCGVYFTIKLWNPDIKLPNRRKNDPKKNKKAVRTVKKAIL